MGYSRKLIAAIFLATLLAGSYLPDAVGSAGSQVSEVLEPDRPNIIMIDIDRLSASRMPCYGYHRNTTPNMCRFGKQNIMFKDAVSQSGYTGSSVASIFTSQYPDVHNLTSYRDELPENRLTMAEMLGDRGYQTVAFPSYSGNYNSQLHRGYGLDQGFDRYLAIGDTLEDNNPEIVETLEGYDRRFFAFVQGWGPHQYVEFSYPLPKKYREQEGRHLKNISDNHPGSNMAEISRFNGTYYLNTGNDTLVELRDRDIEYVQNRYDDSMRYTDRYFGELIKSLKEEGIYSESIIIVTANHGEILDTKTLDNHGNRRFAHGKVYEDTDVPLMIHLPEKQDETVNRKIELIDILPTVLEETNIDPSQKMKESIQGESLRPLYADKSGQGGYEDTRAYSYSHGINTVAVSNSSWKLVMRDREEPFLYNLEEDPLQTRDVSDEYPEIRSKLQNHIENRILKNQRKRLQLYGE